MMFGLEVEGCSDVLIDIVASVISVTNVTFRLSNSYSLFFFDTSGTEISPLNLNIIRSKKKPLKNNLRYTLVLSTIAL